VAGDGTGATCDANPDVSTHLSNDTTRDQQSSGGFTPKMEV